MIARLSLVCAIAAAAVAQNDLIGKLDPRRDDWRAEARAADAADRLSALLLGLAHGGDPDEDAFAPGAFATALRPEIGAAGADRFDVGRLTRQRGGGLTAAASLTDWRDGFASPTARVKVKLLSAVAVGEVLTTRVRVEAFAERGERALEYTGDWRVRWLGGSAGELRIVAIDCNEAVAVVGAARWFVDVTAAVLPRSLRARSDLRRGGDAWPDRLDNIGESTRFGHQGLALGDFDGDGLEDVYVAMCAGLPNLLLRQQPDGTFVDVAEAAGVAFLDDTKGVLLVDLDGDADQDLLLAIGPFVMIAQNDGASRFTRFVRLRAPTDGAFYHLAIADADGDRDLDVYGCRYVEEAWAASVPMPYHDAENGPGNVLFRNDGDLKFTDVTSEVGLDANNTRFSTAAAWADIDGDGDQDLYVSNDFGRNNLYRNDAGRFVDIAAEVGVEDQAAGMGVSFSDVDGDGDLDLYVTNMFSAAGHRIAFQERFQSDLDAGQRRAIQGLALGNTLFLNDGHGKFSRSPDAVVRMGRWGWGARFVDLDNDGREDIVAPNGFLTGQTAADC